MAAIDRLTSLIEQEMDLIEKDSQQLQDHADYWQNVRTQHSLKYAARKQGLSRLGMHIMPSCCVSAVKAKQAIQMHLLCSSLCRTRWANELWTLTDCSWERFSTPPKDCFKKEPSVVEVIFDRDPSNRVWYTLWNACFFLTENGWFKTRCSADSSGCYYTDMFGQKVYYHLFRDDATQFSTTGTWQLLNESSLISSSTHPEDLDCFDGLPPDFLTRTSQPGDRDTTTGRRADTANRTEPNSPVSSSTSSVHDRDSRSGLRERGGGLSPGGERDIGLSTSGLQCAGSLSPSLADLSPGSEEEVPADSSEAPLHPEVQENLISGPEQLCLLVSGTVNRVKCFRHRCRHHHRTKYCNATTTLQIVGEGKSRKGQAMMLLTFKDRRQRESFLFGVTMPPGMEVKKLTMRAE